MKKILVYINVCYWIGIILDAVTAVFMCKDQFFSPLKLSPVNKFGIYIENAGMGAVFMVAWTILLFWASRKPVERRDVLLITAFPVLAGFMFNLVKLMSHGYITHFVLLVWLIIYIILIGLFCTAHILAGQLSNKKEAL